LKEVETAPRPQAYRRKGSDAMKYRPKPVDLSGVAVPEAILESLDVIARNTHDTWAKGRIGEGWVFGEDLDEAKKTHPSLVPYEELPEAEKAYDRATSLETIRMLVHLGYVIQKRGGK
jgi:hypothetical protein